MESREPYITGGNMRELRFDLVIKNKHTGYIHHKKYALCELMIGIDKLFDIENYTTVANRQYTGLEGCYGGDIVKITGEGYYSNDSFTVDEEEWEFIGKVEFNSFMWLVVQEDGTWFSFADMAEGDFGFEIIGNDFENPELLK